MQAFKTSYFHGMGIAPIGPVNRNTNKIVLGVEEQFFCLIVRQWRASHAFLLLLFISALNPLIASAGQFAAQCAAIEPTPLQQVLKSESELYRNELTCVNQKPFLYQAFFKSTGQVRESLVFENSLPVEDRVYTTEGIMTKQTFYKILPNQNILRTIYEVKNNIRAQEILRKEELKNFDPENFNTQPYSIRLKDWVFKEENRNKNEVEYIIHYNEKNPKQMLLKEYVDDKGYSTSFLYFKYEEGNEKPVGFYEINAQKFHDPIPLSKFNLYEEFRPDISLLSANLPEAEKQRRLQHQRNPYRFLLAIIDSGFDYNHPDLAWKWWSNPADPVDGKDNDGNGWIDDLFGWEREKNIGLPTESSTDLRNDARPDSHGTHVAHIATRDLEGVGLIGFAGDYTRANYIDQISKFLKDHKVKVVNISIGLPKDNKDDLGLKDGIKAYARMMNDNPETLFVVASGNENMDIDQHSNKQYPGSINLPNVMKVGSLNTKYIDPSRMNSYAMSPWSNTGLTSVDILAPGEDISAARLGGGYVVHSGSSMASPYMAHEAARLWMMYPDLKAAQVREIFIRSAYPMNPAPQIVSKGFVDFDSAMKLVKEYIYVLPEKARALIDTNLQMNGPNCWNAALYAAGLTSTIRNTNASEFTSWLESPLCKEIPANEARGGDIVAIRQVQKDGTILEGPDGFETHGYLLINSQMGFSKNGNMKTHAYHLQSSNAIKQEYDRAHRTRTCKILDIPKEHCNLTQQYFRCSAQNIDLSAFPELQKIEQETLSLEKDLEAYFLQSALPADWEAQQAKLKTRALNLQNQLRAQSNLQANGLKEKNLLWWTNLLNRRLDSAGVFQ